MKNREVIRRILDYHPPFPADYRGCDDWKAGDPEAECTGVVTALTPSVGVIRKAAALGANLIVAHEPTYYTSADGPGWFEDFPNSVYEEKKRLLEENGIAIWRDHDHLHAHDPDGIFTGVIRYLGWEDHARVDRNTGAGFAHFFVDFPETTLKALCEHIVRTIGLNGLRYVGDPDMKVSSLAIVAHLFPNLTGRPRKDGTPTEYGVGIIETLETQVDVIMPGEVIDWTVLSYVRDALELGKCKAVINPGHFNWEELGMKYAAVWLGELLQGEVPVQYVPSGDMYRFVLGEKAI